MKRKEFIKLMSMAGVGAPFVLNGMPTRFMNSFLDVQATCSEVNDRVLVILRMAGANDGLNTVIPINQYDTYANLRPTIKISNTGASSYIALDTTVASTKQVGLHPVMTGFKSLYDSGKMTLLNGVGYPNPNYSHFRSENLMFAGKDGSTSQDLPDGIFGRYLGSLFPGLSGNPTIANPDPLAIQLGNLNPCLFYEHNTEKNIEYNLSGFQGTLFNQLSIVPSEYNDLLNYIGGVVSSMDAYYNRVMQVFNTGSNSTVTYPNSNLGKQLKTVARMIQGGSKTKIFQVNIGGFDTHVNQIQSGNSALGNHANLLADISNSVAAFQQDIESLGLGNKILTVTFSEFGRQVRENASLGTDHGDLAPFFIIGNSVASGIMGDHPLFRNAKSFYYNQNQRRYDYRQIFASLLQDWLGADTALIADTELETFVAAGQKIDVVQNAKKASVVCSALGTSNVNVSDEIKLYPNPANNFVKLNFGTVKYKKVEISVFDTSGRQILKMNQFNADKELEINTSNLLNGLYIIRIVTDTAEFSKKLVVSH